MIFKRKKKKLENFNALGLINDIALPLTPFVERIMNSDVVFICTKWIPSQCTKLNGRFILLITIVITIIDYQVLLGIS